VLGLVVESLLIFWGQWWRVHGRGFELTFGGQSMQAFQLHGYTLYFFSLFCGHVFFAVQHNLGTFGRGKLLKLV
jgi:hypothetical protein